MAIKIRQGVFETNSSSVHTLTICAKERWESFIKGDLWFNLTNEKLISPQEYKDLPSWEQQDCMNYDQWKTWIDNGGLDVNIITKLNSTGRKTVVVSVDGYNG